MKILLTLSLVLSVLLCRAKQNDLYLFGGFNQDVFLGCITCESCDSQSIWNSVGIYGSKSGPHSIWNPYGAYGSDYSNESAFNENATDPPIVKDGLGDIYGYFTLDRFKRGRMENEFFLLIYQHYQEIRENPTEWHNNMDHNRLVFN